MKNKEYIYILSSMRSGSTLLKSLLSTRTEIADLPEIPLHLAEDIASFVKEQKILIKMPRYYYLRKYPDFEFKSNSKIIILIRDPYDTILSLHKMNLENDFINIQQYNEKLLLDYWTYTYECLYKFIQVNSDNIILVKYESIISDPIKITEKIFTFLNVSDNKGTDTYKNPKGYKWKWGFGDGGDVLKNLKVIARKNKRSNKKLLKLIDESYDVLDLKKKYGYKKNNNSLLK